MVKRGTEVVVDQRVPSPALQTATLRVPAELLPDGEGYTWSARVEAGPGTHSSWTSPCGFSVDRIRPAKPVVEFAPGDAAAAPAGTVRTVRFSVPAGTELDGYCFGVQDEPTHGTGPNHGCSRQWVAAGTDGSATASFTTPDGGGPARLSVFAVDRAGNRSDMAAEMYWITAPAPQARGDFNGDQRPDLLGVGADGKLQLYPGTSDGFGTPVRAAEGDWTGAVLARAGYRIGRGGDVWSNDTRNDLLVVHGGQLSILPGNGDGTFGTPVPVTSAAALDWSGVTQLEVGPGLVSDASLLVKQGDALYQFPLYTTSVGDRTTVVADGWQDRTVAFSDETAEDGLAGKLWVRDAAAGTLALHPLILSYETFQPEGLGGAEPVAADGWSAQQRPSFTAPGDLNGDGRTDLVAVTSAGGLELLAGTTGGGLAEPVALTGVWPAGSQLF